MKEGMRWGRGVIGDLGIALFSLNQIMYLFHLPNPSKK